MIRYQPLFIITLQVSAKRPDHPRTTTHHGMTERLRSGTSIPLPEKREVNRTR